MYSRCRSGSCLCLKNEGSILFIPCLGRNTSPRGYPHSAGWSSLVARRAHNPKVVGSNPAPATNYSQANRFLRLVCLLSGRLLISIAQTARKRTRIKLFKCYHVGFLPDFAGDNSTHKIGCPSVFDTFRTLNTFVLQLMFSEGAFIALLLRLSEYNLFHYGKGISCYKRRTYEPKTN